jgi:hypothetical protein
MTRPAISAGTPLSRNASKAGLRRLGEVSTRVSPSPSGLLTVELRGPGSA